MAALVPFQPLEDAFPEIFKSWPRWFWHEPEFDMRVDVTEDDKAYKVKAVIPGAKKEDVNVQVDGNIITIGAEVKKEKEEKNERYVCQERQYGAVTRSFTLGSAVDEKAATANYVDGVLELKLPKKENGSARRLAIQ